METAHKIKTDSDCRLSDSDRLLLHQLRLMEWMATGRKRPVDDAQESASHDDLTGIPEIWRLTNSIAPLAWQQECIAMWRKNKGHGTAKVVTGAGKTLLALFIAELLQNTEDKDLRIAIVVPTIVLMHQWYEAVLEHGNVPADAIGRLGGGYDEAFSDSKRILISVLASASERLPKLVMEANVEGHLMLIADECHHAGASEMSKVLKTKCRWSLGLSATPERDDEDDAGYDESLLGKRLGPIIYEFTLADALREGLVPKFTINHYGLSMTTSERQRYDGLSRSITDAMSQLKAQRDAKSDGDFFAWARSVASRNQGDVGKAAMRFISDVSKRRELLSHLEARHDAAVQILEREFQINPGARVILFHESIAGVMDLFACLRQRGLKAIAEHSELPPSIRETGLDLFRKGIAQIIVSARSLIEGFNVPAVDVGIIVASTGSVRQRIQSLGRMLRRHRGPGGEEKTSCIYVLYAAGSVDETIYSKVDWYEATGVDTNRFYHWDLDAEPSIQDGPPRKPLPKDEQIETDSLEPGYKYPGQYEGTEFSCDSQRNITNASGQYAMDTAEISQAILNLKPNGGKFRVTPKRHFVLIRVPSDEEWETLFVTQLAKPLRFSPPIQTVGSSKDILNWVSTARTGDIFPFFDISLTDGELYFKQKSGGIISKKVRGGEVFARTGEKARDADKGADAERLVAAIKDLQKIGRKVSRIAITEMRHAIYRDAGLLYFICALDAGLEFPEVPSE